MISRKVRRKKAKRVWLSKSKDILYMDKDTWITLLTLLTTLISTVVSPILIFWLNSKTNKDIKDLRRNDESLKEENKLTRTEINTLLEEREKRVRLEEELNNLKIIYSWVRDDRDKMEKEIKKLESENNQLEIVLVWLGIKKEELGIDGNISFFEWLELPKTKLLKEEMINKMRKKRNSNAS